MCVWHPEGVHLKGSAFGSRIDAVREEGRHFGCTCRVEDQSFGDKGRGVGRGELGGGGLAEYGRVGEA